MRRHWFGWVGIPTFTVISYQLTALTQSNKESQTKERCNGESLMCCSECSNNINLIQKPRKDCP